MPVWLLRWLPSYNPVLHVSRACFDCFCALPVCCSLFLPLSFSPSRYPALASFMQFADACDARMPRSPVSRSRLKSNFGLRLGRFLGFARPVWVSVQFSRSPRLAARCFRCLVFSGLSGFSVLCCPFLRSPCRVVYQMRLPGPCVKR